MSSSEIDVLERELGARRSGQGQVDGRLGPGDERREQRGLRERRRRRAAGAGVRTTVPLPCRRSTHALLLEQAVGGHDGAAADVDQLGQRALGRAAGCPAAIRPCAIDARRASASRAVERSIAVGPVAEAADQLICALVWSICPRLALEMAQRTGSLGQCVGGL